MKKGSRKRKQHNPRKNNPKPSNALAVIVPPMPTFLVNVSSVGMCFDLPLKKSNMYNIIQMKQQQDGMSIGLFQTLSIKMLAKYT
jgi:hypothetical protein